MRHAKSMGRTYDFYAWSRPQSDPTQIRLKPVRCKPVRPNLNRLLPPFGSVFGSFCDRFGSAHANASANASTNISEIASANVISNASTHASANQSAHESAGARADASANVAVYFASDRKQSNCYLIRAIGGMSIDR